MDQLTLTIRRVDYWRQVSMFYEDRYENKATERIDALLARFGAHAMKTEVAYAYYTDYSQVESRILARLNTYDNPYKTRMNTGRERILNPPCECQVCRSTRGLV